jgi:hypothetical protein
VERIIESVRIRARGLVLLAAAVLVALLSAGRTSAHDLKAMVELQDPVKVEAWFDDDTPAQQARVQVVNVSGEEVAAGLTDDRGVWTFPKPGPGRYRISIESIGHKTDVRFTIPGAEQPELQPSVEPEPRLNNRLGLILGLTLTLGGSLAFVVLRRMRKDASESPPAAHP